MYLPDGELNPGLPRDRRGYLPLYYRGWLICQWEWFKNFKVIYCVTKRPFINLPYTFLWNVKVVQRLIKNIDVFRPQFPCRSRAASMQLFGRYRQPPGRQPPVRQPPDSLRKNPWATYRQGNIHKWCPILGGVEGSEMIPKNWTFHKLGGVKINSPKIPKINYVCSPT